MSYYVEMLSHSNDKNVSMKSVVNEINTVMATEAFDECIKEINGYLNEKSAKAFDFDKLCAECKLGHWIYTLGQIDNGTDANFLEVRKLHKKFHDTTNNIVAMFAKGKKAEGEQMVKEEFEPITKSIHKNLVDLRKNITAGKMVSNDSYVDLSQYAKLH